MAGEKKSPLKDAPLRNPGQSVEDEAFNLRYDEVFTPLMIAVFLVLLALLEWLRSYRAIPPTPLLHSTAAVAAVTYAAFRIWRARPKLTQLRQALDGERSVGQFLERLRQDGYQVFHDVIGEGFNIDHVVIGPAGVFSLETKTFSKPRRGESKIQFDGAKILVNGFSPDRDPVIQAKAQAAWLRELLSESAGKKYQVRPVVLFPGWFVQRSKPSTKELWVLNPKAFPEFLDHEPSILSDSDIKLASFHLSRFIRSSNRRHNRS